LVLVGVNCECYRDNKMFLGYNKSYCLLISMMQLLYFFCYLAAADNHNQSTRTVNISLGKLFIDVKVYIVFSIWISEWSRLRTNERFTGFFLKVMMPICSYFLIKIILVLFNATILHVGLKENKMLSKNYFYNRPRLVRF
jgi:nucleoside recognition membrane protein YjiH